MCFRTKALMILYCKWGCRGKAEAAKPLNSLRSTSPLTPKGGITKLYA